MIEGTHPGEVRYFVHKRIIGAAKGFARGGFSGAAGGFLTAGSRAPTRGPSLGRTSFGVRGRPKRNPPARRVVNAPGFPAAIQRFVPGGRTGLMLEGTAAGSGCPQGFHPNKSDYFTQTGFVAKHSKCVKNRRRNLSNGRANTKALRRMAAWDKQERKLGATMKKIARGR